MESPKGEWEEMEMSAQPNLTLPITAKNQARGKPRISVLTSLQCSLCFPWGNLYTCSIYWFITGKVRMETGKSSPGLCRGCSHSLAHIMSPLWHRMVPKKATRIDGEDVEHEAKRWRPQAVSEVRCITLKMCLMCVHDNTAAPALTGISSYITNKYNFTANFSSFAFVKSHRTTGKVKKNANVKTKLNFEAFLPSEFVVPWETLSNHKCQLQEPAWGVTFVLSFLVKINVIKKHTAPVQQILCGCVWEWSVHL